MELGGGKIGKIAETIRGMFGPKWGFADAGMANPCSISPYGAICDIQHEIYTGNINRIIPSNNFFKKIINLLGSPALTVPIGKSSATNMPLGIQLAAAPFNEAILISVAKELEKAFGGWVAPGKMPKELMESMDLHFWWKKIK